MPIIKKILASIVICSFFLQAATAGKTDEPISEADKKALIKAVCERIEKIYAFTENIKKTCDLLKSNLEQGAYAKYTSPREFASRLNEDLEIVTHDKHFGISYDPKQAAEMAEQAKTSENYAFYTPQLVRQYRRMNYGFKELKILEGNVGYLDLRDFFPLKWVADSAVAAMNFLANCDAVIIDLRFNGGGEDLTVNFLLSYFLDSSESTITFNTNYTRFNNSYYQATTWPYVPGKTLYHMPLYLLTSKTSFSGAEAFAFRLKNLQRATLVGETTRGGANPVEIQEIGRKYVIYIPSSKSVGSMTAADWEGVGVKPDIEVEASEALTVAHLEAIKALSAKSGDEKDKFLYQWTSDGIKAKNHPFPVNPALFQSYMGVYGDRIIGIHHNELYFQRGERAKMKMIAMAENLFMIENMDYLRLRFVKEKDGTVSLESLYDDGRVTSSAKNKTQENSE
ncbi:MAG TPA: S41 family peptidase [Patescibacteria group bacterium]|nr:S41 family peptidase [Patescibacteria group bacterium]